VFIKKFENTRFYSNKIRYATFLHNIGICVIFIGHIYIKFIIFNIKLIIIVVINYYLSIQRISATIMTEQSFLVSLLFKMNCSFIIKPTMDFTIICYFSTFFFLYSIVLIEYEWL